MTNSESESAPSPEAEALRLKLYRDACDRLEKALEAIAPYLAGHTEDEDYNDAVVIHNDLKPSPLLPK